MSCPYLIPEVPVEVLETTSVTLTCRARIEEKMVSRFRGNDGVETADI